MEIAKSQIARLVLGYLKNEKCEGAFNEFLTNSQYLKEQALFSKNGKYFATRVGGLTLEDLISEYSKMSFIIQGRLEQTSYYDEHHKTSLVEQLNYLLDNIQESTSPLLSNDLNTTPSESLPGNSVEHENISQILSQTLLEKPELHEKLADAINSVRQTPDEKEDADSVSKQLDTKIKAIVQKAEQDPIFDKILYELIDNNPKVPDKNSLNNSEPQSCSTPRKSSTEGNASSCPSRLSGGAFPQKTELKTENPPAAVPSSTPNSSASDIIIFNGNLDSYVSKATTVAPLQQSQIFVTNTPGIVMLPSMIQPNYLILNNNQNSTHKTFMSDNDIMKMPTVILDDEPTQTKPASNAPQSRKMKPLVPKSDGITVSTLTGDYLALYKDDGQVVVSTEREDLTAPKKEPTTSKKDAASKDVTSAKKQPNKSTRSALRKTLPRQAKMKKDASNSEKEKLKSPSTPVNKKNVKTKTPRSGSHVRTLDFTSPLKDEGDKKTESSERTPETAKKKGAKNLFKTDRKSSTEVKEKPEWDSGLRELLVPKFPLPKSPDSSDDKLDLTCEHDEELEKGARLLEAAFKTPIKAPEEKDKSQEVIVVSDSVEKKQETVIETVLVEETEVYLRNCNAPPKFKKKCNVTNNKVQEYEVEVVEIVESTTKISQPVENDVLLETPVKFPPKTPRKTELTPFSKVFEEQIQGIDLLSMPTPNLLTTPSFPLTPGLGLSSPAPTNRPTDYSTSSSYYQPSDTEQNKSLELMIEECKKLEKRKKDVKEHYDMNMEEDSDVPDNRSELPRLSDMKREFNQNMVGKKNLNLMKQLSPPSCSSDDSSSSDSSNCSSNSSKSSSDSSSDSDSDYDPKDGPESVEKKGSYALRNKPASPDGKSETPSTPAPNKILSVSEEIEDKKERMLKHLKNDAKLSAKSTPKNNLKDKLVKSCKKVLPKRKARTPVKKTCSKVSEKLSKLCEVENEITDDDFALHLSTDEETINKLSNENVTGKEKIATSDLEAEQLVQGLKERGILLVHNKSPKKPSDSTDDQILNETGKIENLSLSSSDLEVSFDIQCFTEENHLKVDSTNSKKKTKKIVYDLKNLDKEIIANVYIEVLDVEMERKIKCTPFQSLLAYSPNDKSVKAKRKTVKKEDSSQEAKKVKKEDSSQEAKKVKKEDSSQEAKKVKKDDSSQETKKVKKEEKSEVKKKDRKTSERKSVSHKSKCDKETLEAEEVGKVVPTKDEVEVVQSRDVDKVVEGEEKTDVQVNSSPLKASEDDLMNYAILGSQREENPESPKSGMKRKYSSSEENEPADKKCKTEQHQALLKKIDVDTFLNKVHGNTGR